MIYPSVKLADRCDLITKGTTPTSLGFDFTDNGIPFIRAQNLVDGSVSVDADPLFIDATTHAALRRSTIKPNDVLLSIAGTIGRAAIVPPHAVDMNCNQAVAIVRADASIDRRFLLHWLNSQDAVGQIARGKVTGTISNLSLGQIGLLEIPLPPLDEQKRIAAILDQADALRRLRTRALDRLNALGQAIFHDMFGDPAANTFGFPQYEIGDVVEKFSDGPFGSNLKSSHYVDVGVRVIRLQNIGVGEYVDRDRAFVSAKHYSQLSRHDCRPGDVLIGTLGDPNLRACKMPHHIPIALNKADCVQLRPNKLRALADYWVALLNHPSTLTMAGDKVLGQTRSRISMGRLRTLRVPVPPIELQSIFQQRIEQLSELTKAQKHCLLQAESLFTSLQHRAFRGEL